MEQLTLHLLACNPIKHWRALSDESNLIPHVAVWIYMVERGREGELWFNRSEWASERLISSQAGLRRQRGINLGCNHEANFEFGFEVWRSKGRRRRRRCPTPGGTPPCAASTDTTLPWPTCAPFSWASDPVINEKTCNPHTHTRVLCMYVHTITCFAGSFSFRLKSIRCKLYLSL